MVVANDIKCEAQQELRTVKRRLLEEEEKNARLQKELGDMQGHSRLVMRGAAPLCLYESKGSHRVLGFLLNHHAWPSVMLLCVSVLKFFSFLSSFHHYHCIVEMFHPVLVSAMHWPKVIGKLFTYICTNTLAKCLLG